MAKKPVFDYKEPFESPTVVREITKQFKLPFSITSDVIAVALISFFLSGLCIYLFFGLNEYNYILPFLFGWLGVELFTRIEPDGKKLHLFVFDYFRYLFLYQIPKNKIMSGERIKRSSESFVYEKISVDDLLER